MERLGVEPPFESPHTTQSVQTKRFYVDYYPLSSEFPMLPVYLADKSPPPQAAAPSHTDALPAYDEVHGPAYLFHLDDRTQRTHVLKPGGDSIAEISFLKPKEPVVVAEEISGKESATMETHTFRKPKGTSFETSRGCYQWQKSGVKDVNQLQLVWRTEKPSRKESPAVIGDAEEILATMGVDPEDAGRVVLEMRGEVISEGMFLGTALAMLKRSDLKVASKSQDMRTASGKNWVNSFSIQGLTALF